MLEVRTLPILDDNYTYIIKSDNGIAIVDPGDAAPIIRYLNACELKPDYILNTHHHGDHINGNAGLTEEYGAKLIAPKKDASRIPDINQAVSDGDTLNLLGDEIIVTDTLGHTSGHVSFYFKKAGVLFSGDTMFAMGCGRLFEGTAEQMFEAFQYYKNLPDNTSVYFGHEYTQANGEFCLSVAPDNEELKNRMLEVNKMRAQYEPTVPTTIGLEKKTSVFMMAETAEHFAELRSKKDQF